MASIRKNKNGTYTATIYIGRDAAGKHIREYITRDGSKECKLAAKERELEIEELGLNNLSKMRFSAWADKWLEIEKSRLAPSTYVAYKMYVNSHFKPYFKDLKLGKITEIQVKEYISQKLKKISSTTARKHFFTLSAMFYAALKTKSPMRDLAAPEKRKYIPYIVKDDEFRHIHSAVKGSIDEIIILLTGWNGLRPGEIFALKSDDIFFNDEKIRIDESCSISEDGYVDGDPKSANGFRVIDTPPYLMGLLKKHLKENMDKQRLFDMQPASYSQRWRKIVKTHNALLTKKIECIKNGKPFEQKPRTGQNKKSLTLNLHIQDAPLPDCRFYDLRHYHATVLYKSGMPDQYAAVRMGHDVAVLKKVYQHLQADEETRLNDKVKAIFTP